MFKCIAMVMVLSICIWPRMDGAHISETSRSLWEVRLDAFYSLLYLMWFALSQTQSTLGGCALMGQA